MRGMSNGVCSHADRAPAPCGDDTWCMKDAGHEDPHTGQEVRCACGTPRSASRQPGYKPPGPYEVARAAYVKTGDQSDFERMLDLVSSP